MHCQGQVRFVFFTETNLNFSLNAAGETIYLINPAHTRVLDAVRRVIQTIEKAFAEAVQFAEHHLLELGQRHRACSGLQVGDRVVAGRDPHALVMRRQEVTVPHLRPGDRIHTQRTEFAEPSLAIFGNCQPLTPELFDRLRSLPDARLAVADGPDLELSCPEVQPTLVRLLAVLNELNVTVSRLETHEPNLERVFLHLTGHGLRD